MLDNSLLCLVAENTLDTIFVHLKQFYAPRKQPRIEVMGKFYFVKQYMVKFGAISIGSTNRGIVVEVRSCTYHVYMYMSININEIMLITISNK